MFTYVTIILKVKEARSVRRDIGKVERRYGKREAIKLLFNYSNLT